MSRPARLVMLVALAAAGLAAAGCGQQPSETSTAATSTIDVLVPCGQIGPFSEIVTLFEEANPGVTVEWVPENIVTMTTKVLDDKARPDLFLSMGDLEMDQLEQGGKVIEGTRSRYAENSLGIMVPKDNPARVAAIQDLTKPAVKMISVPDPEQNSVGKHAFEALRGAGIWDQVKDKILIARFAADGKDVTAKGQVQASIGYYPCAVEVHVAGQEPAEPRKLKLVGQVPADLYQPFYCEAAVIEGAKNPEGGKALLEFLKSPAAQDIFVKWQFVGEAPAEGVGA